MKFLKKAFEVIYKKAEFYSNRQLVSAISALPGDTVVTLIDIGAAGGLERRWKSIQDRLGYVGFEPDERSIASLSPPPNIRNYKIFPYAVSDRAGKMHLNLCRKPQVSSEFRPNRLIINLFKDSRRFDIVDGLNIPSKRLDDFTGLTADFLKIDIQGGELKALNGANLLLDELLGLEVEVSFIHLYEEQPLFGEIASKLASHDFQFMDFIGLHRWGRDGFTGYGQCVFGDALFLKSPESVIEAKESKKICSYLAILLLYQRFDLIKTTIGLMGDEMQLQFLPFIKRINSIEKKHLLSKKIIKCTNRIMRLYDHNSTAYHLV